MKSLLVLRAALGGQLGAGGTGEGASRGLLLLPRGSPDLAGIDAALRGGASLTSLVRNGVSKSGLGRHRKACLGLEGRIEDPRSPPFPRGTPVVAPTRAEGERGVVVYFIQSQGTWQIKVGTTSVSAEERLRNLQAANATPLRLLATIPGDASTEARLHMRFAHFRAKGEWFWPAPELGVGARAARARRAESRLISRRRISRWTHRGGSLQSAAPSIRLVVDELEREAA